MSLAKALLAFQQDPPPVHLDATNPHFRSKYASLGGVVAAVRPALTKHGLAYTQLADYDEQPVVITRLIHAESGEVMETSTPLFLSKQDAQGYGSALTYARRYALLSILGLVGDEDDDANLAVRRADPPVGGDVSGGRSAIPPDPAPSPESSFKVPEKAREGALGFEQSRADALVEQPADGGDPNLVRVHFGKNAGKTLGELTLKQKEWYANTWTPKPEYESPQDRRLKLAARILTGAETGGFVDDPAIPF